MSEQSFIYIGANCSSYKAVLRAFGIALLCAVSACSPQKREPDARVVLVDKVRAPLLPGMVAIGTVRAVEAHDVPAQNGGRIISLMADVGQSVRAGEILARLDSRAETLALSQAESEYKRLQAVAVERNRNLQRMTALAKANAVSSAAFDSAKSDASASAQAAAAAHDAVALARRNLDLTVIRAPADGVVASRSVKLSDVLAAGSIAFEIDGAGAREITATTDEATASKLVVGSVVVFCNGEATGTARLIRVGERSAGTGARDVRLQIISGNAAAGAVVEVLLKGNGPAQGNAEVPLGAIAENTGAVKTVFIVDKTAHVRAVPVQLVAVGSYGALIKGAVHPDETVVTAGTSFLRDGMAVRPVLTAR